jgi:PAS domain S-box-containing protein
MFGWRASEITGKRLPTVPEEKGAEFDMLQTQAIEGKGFTGKELLRLKKDGSMIPISLSVAAVHNDQGDIIGIMGAAEDISDRRIHLSHIEHLNQVLRTIRTVNRLIVRERDKKQLIRKGCRLLVAGRGYPSAMIVLTDLEQTPVWWAMEGLAGKSESLEMILEQGNLPACCDHARHQQGVLLIRDRDRDRVCRNCPLLQPCSENQSMCASLVQEKTVFGYLTVAVEKDSVVNDEEQGLFSEVAQDFAYALNMMRISDERRKGKAALDESEARFRLMVESAPEPIFIQTDHCFAYVNPKAVKLFGAQKEGDLIGTPVMERFHPDYHDIVNRRIRSLNVDRRPVEELLELKFIRLDGTEVWVETTGQPIRYDGRDGALVFVRDISARKRLEQKHEKLSAQFMQAQKMESVGRLAGGVAHDYNNMLSVIIGFTELALAETASDPALQADLKEVLNAARRPADITRQLLAFARKQTIAPRVLDLNKTMTSMLRMLQRLIGEDIDLSWRPGPGPMPVFMDPSQLDQLVANLCVNARDAIRGVGKLTIETGRVRFDADYCDTHPGFIPGAFFMLAVSDDGCGMDKATLETIFEPFFTTKKAGKGTGLGMSTVFGIVKQNKGFINVYSEPGKGTTVRVYLPPKDVVPDQEILPEDTDIPAGNGETVLVVEDEASILNLAQKCLEHLGYTVLTAATPARAKADADRHSGKIHLLLTDVVMPEQNGRDLARDLRDRYPDIRVVFMSGYTANVIAHQGVLDDGVNFLQKPFSNRDLAVMVKKALGG